MIHNLKVIYARLTNQLSSEFPLITEVERAKIITPIADEITGCTPGLYNRAIGAVRNFTLPQTIAALLMRVRSALVDDIARGISSNVLINTRVVTIANVLGFGVPLINGNDPFQGDRDLNDLIMNKLLHRISIQFRPFTMIGKIVEQLQLAIALHGYTGKRDVPVSYTDLSQPIPAYGYDKGQYEQFLSYLQLILGEGINSGLLILDSNDQVIELDWHAIKLLVWSRLVQDHYFTHPIEWIQAFDPDETTFNAEMLQILFAKPEDFIQYLRCFSELSIEKIRDLTQCYIDEFLRTNPTLTNLFMLELLMSMSEHAEPILNLLFDVLKEQYWAILKEVLLNRSMTKQKILEKFPLFIRALVKIVTFLSIAEQHAVFLQCHFALSTAIRTNSPMVLSLIDKLSILQPEQLAQLFTIIRRGDSLLMLLMESSPNIQVLKRVLGLLATCKQTDIEKILLQVNADDYNVLMLAISDAPELAMELLTFMQATLSPQAIYQIMHQKSNGDNRQTALIMAAIEQPSLLMPLFHLIDAVDKKHHAALLQQANVHDSNILIMTLRSSEIATLLPLINLIVSLPIQDSSALFSYRTTNHETAFTIAASMPDPLAVQRIRQCVLAIILTHMLAVAIRGETSPIEAYTQRIIELTQELMHLLSSNDALKLKEKFRQYAALVVQLARPTPSFFSSRTNGLVEQRIFAVLDYFDAPLASAVTGGYANSDMLLAEFTPSISVDSAEPPHKIRRLNPKP